MSTAMQTPEQKTFKNRPSHRFYHATKDKNGAASQWEYDNEKKLVWLTLANQTGEDSEGNATFGWRKWDKNTQSFGEHDSLSMALGLSDIGEILSVIRGLKNRAGTEKGLYHSNQSGHSVLTFSVYEKEGKFVCMNLGIDNKLNTNKEYTKIRHNLNYGELEVLRIMLEEATRQILGF